MIDRERDTINNSNKLDRITAGIERGIRSLGYSWTSRIMLFIYAVALVLIHEKLPHIEYSLNRALYFFTLPDEVYEGIFIIISVIATCILFICLGSPLKALTISVGLRRSGFTNSIGETPILIYIRKNMRIERAFDMEFVSKGIPVAYFREHIDALESALNMRVTGIKAGTNPRRIQICAIKASTELSNDIPWKDVYVSKEESTLVLGKSLLGAEVLDLDKTPHILIASASGGGKSVMLRCLAHQAALKGFDLTLVDFKGGVEFSGSWAGNYSVVTDEDSLLESLGEIVCEMKERQTLLAASGCKNITEYNKHFKEKMIRKFIVFDEVAECLDKTGLTGEKKKKIQEIEHLVSSISRLGRATGINLCLGMQRPDANVLTGQIKTNITKRLCGVSDPILAEIVHGNRDASNLIDKSEKGRFLDEDGTLIQGFNYVDEDSTSEATE